MCSLGYSRREQQRCDDSGEEDTEEEAEEDDDDDDVELSVSAVRNGIDGGDRRAFRVLSPNVLGEIRAREVRIWRPWSSSSDESATRLSQDWLWALDIFVEKGSERTMRAVG